jgi:hypothetical protein
MVNKLKAIPLAELVEDMSVYPRHGLDEQHVGQLVLALKSGATLPPLVADAASKRLVDGWHRSRAYRRVLGENAAVAVDLRSYASEAMLIEDAVALNAMHGRRLDRMDQVRAVLLMERAGVERVRIAATLHMPEERIEKLRIRVALAPPGDDGQVPGTGMVVLKRPMAHLAGTQLSREQVEAHESQAGTSHLLQVHQIRDALRYHLVNPEDERLHTALVELRDELHRYLGDAKGVAA